MEVDNDKDQLPENLFTRWINRNNEYTYQEFSHSCICYRKNIVKTNSLPQLKEKSPMNFNQI